mgnify:CR=1 FL=1|jgi:macrodomain Ter protein organizer (MatP/YcbG family)|tara:strand:- start:357 stop:527 length:171 start_codon:yes stop_codon:yes gene_type:complete
MPNVQKYKSVAVPVNVWEKLWEISNKNHRSPSKQISFFVDEEMAKQSKKPVSEKVK